MLFPPDSEMNIKEAKSMPMEKRIKPRQISQYFWTTRAKPAQFACRRHNLPVYRCLTFTGHIQKFYFEAPGC